MGISKLLKWTSYYKLPAENLELIGRLVSVELLEMDRPQVSEAFQRVYLKLGGMRCRSYKR